MKNKKNIIRLKGKENRKYTLDLVFEMDVLAWGIFCMVSIDFVIN